MAPVTLVHMSDNGENYYYWRPGWELMAEGEFQDILADGLDTRFYAHPQHYSVWQYAPEA